MDNSAPVWRSLLLSIVNSLQQIVGAYAPPTTVDTTAGDRDVTIEEGLAVLAQVVQRCRRRANGLNKDGRGRSLSNRKLLSPYRTHNSLPERLDSEFSDNEVVAFKDPRVLHALEMIADRYGQHGLTERAIARSVGLSLWYFSRLFAHHMDVTFRQHLQVVRLTHGRRLLETTALSVKEIAYLVGYNHTSTFDRAFGRQYGFAPNDVKRKTS